MESDNTGKIYISSPEHNAINTFDPSTGLVSVFVRSPMLAWPDTLRCGRLQLVASADPPVT
jgi:hypothetical protein